MTPPPSTPSERDRPDEDNTHLGMSELLADTLAREAVEQARAEGHREMSEPDDEEETKVEGARRGLA
jgi:hypothetical protein